ncbi:hypothetical protein LTR70_003181 [Exophiala xenobiotica]|uniref:Protein kinase domain-containing protein n=1 Tax=Lithohypha guttulata TaxID=1690604 RepID=A0ABR0KGS5_9EURO|nr:hypothetical protein LTR24_002826 [Lithohypha guttulata]KAK5323693.1 hypothetical protein LTR70_003181 [Exophiala xenobiotica]
MTDFSLDDAFSWATSISRTRLTSVAGFGLQSTIDPEAVSDLQSILRAIRELNIPYVPYRDLRALEPIGEGVTFSVVTHYWADKIVALKHIKQSDNDETKDKNAFRKRLKSVLQEILVMHHGPLAAHPHVVDLLGYGWHQSRVSLSPYIVVEYGSLGSLRHFLQSKKPWKSRNKIILAGDVAAGLMALHQAGVVHGDLKLDNVICFQSWSRPSGCRAKLCDFSHSIEVTEDPKSVRYYGTPLYLPPEAIEQHARPISSSEVHKCDIWAWGLALWEILIDGDVYFESQWLHSPEYSRASSVDHTTGTLGLPQPMPHPVGEGPQAKVATDQVIDQSLRGATFGNFDLGHLRALARRAVDNLCLRDASGTGFIRSYLRPLVRLTLDPDPNKRVYDISRSPIIAEWQSAAPDSALQSKLAFHAHSRHLSFDIFRPDRQADISWNAQVHIHSDIESIVENDHGGARSAQLSFQLALCKALGFGCNIDNAKALEHLRIGLEHDVALTHFTGRPLEASFSGVLTLAVEPFSDRLARMFYRQWDLDITTTISLCEKPSAEGDTDEVQTTVEPMTMTALARPSALLEEATTLWKTSRQRIIARSLVRLEKQRLSLSWVELAIFLEDHLFLERYRNCIPCADLSRMNSWANSPLMLACCKGQPKAVYLLLEAGADPEFSTPDGCNLLHFLFCLKDQAMKVLKLVVNLYPGIVNKINQPCQRVFVAHTQWPTEVSGSPLAIAVTAGHVPLVHELLALGAKAYLPAFTVPSGDKTDIWTPLHIAVKYNFIEIVGMLLRMNPESIKKLQHADTGRLPLATALSFLTPVERFGIHGPFGPKMLKGTIDYLPTNVLLQAGPKGSTPLLQALDYENYEVVSSLLERLPSLASTKITNPANPKSFTLPLHFACQICARKDTQDVLLIPKRILKTSSRTLRLVDDAGRTPLHLAVMSDFPIVSKWLAREGLDVNICDDFRRSPLMLCQSLENTTALLQLGAKVGLRDRQGRNAAHYAVSRGDLGTLQLLVEHGIQADAVTNSGRALLHDAVRAMSLQCVRALCQAGASLNVRDQDGATPLHLAVDTTPDIVRTLVEKGSAITLEDKRGHTAVQRAIARINEGTEDSRYTSHIFKCLISPLCETLEEEERNETLLVQVLHVCAQYGDVDTVTAFFACLHVNSNINASSEYQGRTPLHAAVAALNFDAARILLRVQHADPNALDREGRTVLMVLCAAEHRGEVLALFCDLLMAHGARIDEDAWTLALRHNSFRLIQCLLDGLPIVDATLILERAPVTSQHLLAAIDAGEIGLVAAFLQKAHRLPATYEPEMSKKVSYALRCLDQWPVIAQAFHYICTRNPELPQPTMKGTPLAGDDRDWLAVFVSRAFLDQVPETPPRSRHHVDMFSLARFRRLRNISASEPPQNPDEIQLAFSPAMSRLHGSEVPWE